MYLEHWQYSSKVLEIVLKLFLQEKWKTGVYTLIIKSLSI